MQEMYLEVADCVGDQLFCVGVVKVCAKDEDGQPDICNRKEGAKQTHASAWPQ